MNTDPIADMLTRIRNATGHQTAILKMPSSRLKEAIGKALVKSGYLEKSELIETKTSRPDLVLTLKYYAGQPVIKGLSRVSKPGQRTYRSATGLSKFLSSRLEDVIVSTSQGLMTGHEACRAGLGGEVLFKVW